MSTLAARSLDGAKRKPGGGARGRRGPRSALLYAGYMFNRLQSASSFGK